jgi:hypothetical protein
MQKLLSRTPWDSPAERAGVENLEQFFTDPCIVLTVHALVNGHYTWNDAL